MYIHFSNFILRIRYVHCIQMQCILLLFSNDVYFFFTLFNMDVPLNHRTYFIRIKLTYLLETGSKNDYISPKGTIDCGYYCHIVPKWIGFYSHSTNGVPLFPLCLPHSIGFIDRVLDIKIRKCSWNTIERVI